MARFRGPCVCHLCLATLTYRCSHLPNPKVVKRSYAVRPHLRPQSSTLLCWLVSINSWYQAQDLLHLPNRFSSVSRKSILHPPLLSASTLLPHPSSQLRILLRFYWGNISNQIRTSPCPHPLHLHPHSPWAHPLYPPSGSCPGLSLALQRPHRCWCSTPTPFRTPATLGSRLHHHLSPLD